MPVVDPVGIRVLGIDHKRQLPLTAGMMKEITVDCAQAGPGKTFINSSKETQI